MSLEKTYQILRRSKQDSVAVVLSAGIASGDAPTRDRCIETLAHREDEASHRVLTRAWLQHREAILDRLECRPDHRAAWFDHVIAVLDDPDTSESELCIAIDIAAQFRLTDALTRLIELARDQSRYKIKELILDSVLSLSHHWGTLTRNQYSGIQAKLILERQRLNVMKRFQAVQRDYHRHRCEKLIDAMLSLAHWNDPTLQSILNEDTPTRKVVLRRLRTSKARGVATLLTGFVRRRHIPKSVIGILWQRSDGVFREIFLRAVSASPDGTIVQHLQEYGLPECLRGGAELVERVDRAHDAALAQAYSAAMGQNPESLLVILKLIDRHMHAATAAGSPPTETSLVAFAHSLNRCRRPSIEFWLKAMNSSIMDGEVMDGELIEGKPDDSHDCLDPQSDLAAQICRGLVELLLQGDPPLSTIASGLLSELNVQQALPRFRQLSPIQRRRFGRTLIQIDSQTIETVQDGLRHAVMQRRLEAIEFAKTLGLVDLMVEPLTKIALGDHQIARMAVTEALAEAQGEASASLLRELCHCEQPSLSDAAREALEMRGLAV